MGLDKWLVKSLNHWGESHTSLVKLVANDFVYLVLAFAAGWLFLRVLRIHKSNFNLLAFIKDLILKGLFIFIIPVGLATVISKIITTLFVRQRPFVVLPDVKLLVAHSPDGGMPSHHMLFMAAIVAMVFFYNRKFAALLFALTLLSGIARIVAGIHYPSDIVVGMFLGWLLSRTYIHFVCKSSGKKYLSLKRKVLSV